VAVVLVSAFLRISAADWRWIVLAIALVWIAEALNTAVEQLGDAICLEQNPRIGFAKDVAAGAVLVSALAATVIGALTLLPYFVVMF
jgi:diacylglycerol kinase (ATP)